MSFDLLPIAHENVAAVDPCDMQYNHPHLVVVNDAPRIALICVAALDLISRSGIRNSKALDLNMVVLRPIGFAHFKRDDHVREPTTESRSRFRRR
jgi:hypothetical protein